MFDLDPQSKQLAMMGLASRLLAGSGSSPTPQTFGSRLGQAGLGSLGDINQLLSAAQEKKMKEKQMEEMESSIKMRQMQAKQLKADLDFQENMQKAIEKIGQNASMGQSQPTPPMMGAGLGSPPWMPQGQGLGQPQGTPQGMGQNGMNQMMLMGMVKQGQYPQAYSALNPEPKEVDYNKPFLPDGRPNPSYQKYQEGLAQIEATGKMTPPGAVLGPSDKRGLPTVHYLEGTPEFEKRKQTQKDNQATAETVYGLVDRMSGLIKENPRATATPLKPAIQMFESASSMFNPQRNAGPALQIDQLRDALLTQADMLVEDGKMSNQDRERLESAIGIVTGTTPGNALDSLNIIIDIFQRNTGIPYQETGGKNKVFDEADAIIGQ